MIHFAISNPEEQKRALVFGTTHSPAVSDNIEKN